MKSRRLTMRAVNGHSIFSHALMGAALFVLIAAQTIAPQRVISQSSQAQQQRINLSNGAFIELSQDWTPQPPIPPPPPPQLAPFAPKVTFREVLAFENPRTHSTLRLATTSNPFRGRDEVALDTQIHNSASSGGGLIDYLFSFFFPPPQDCLNAGVEAFKRANSDQNAPENPGIRTDCRYSPTLSDFYSSQLSPAIMLEGRKDPEKASGLYEHFYLPPMEKLESNGLTFYIFEAQAQKELSQVTVNRFNLPDDLQGAQADYLWAIGAPSPFPFSFDPQRKNVQVFQVAFAGVGFGANKREQFIKLLKQMGSVGTTTGNGF